MVSAAEKGRRERRGPSPRSVTSRGCLGCDRLVAGSSSTDQDAVGGSLDDLSDGRVPGFTASGPDGDGEAEQLQGRCAGVRSRVGFPGAIGETDKPPALKGRRHRQRVVAMAWECTSWTVPRGGLSSA